MRNTHKLTFTLCWSKEAYAKAVNTPETAGKIIYMPTIFWVIGVIGIILIANLTSEAMEQDFNKQIMDLSYSYNKDYKEFSSLLSEKEEENEQLSAKVEDLSVAKSALNELTDHGLLPKKFAECDEFDNFFTFSSIQSLADFPEIKFVGNIREIGSNVGKTKDKKANNASSKDKTLFIYRPANANEDEFVFSKDKFVIETDGDIKFEDDMRVLTNHIDGDIMILTNNIEGKCFLKLNECIIKLSDFKKIENTTEPLYYATFKFDVKYNPYAEQITYEAYCTEEGAIPPYSEYSFDTSFLSITEYLELKKTN